MLVGQLAGVGRMVLCWSIKTTGGMLVSQTAGAGMLVCQSGGVGKVICWLVKTAGIGRYVCRSNSCGR